MPIKNTDHTHKTVAIIPSAGMGRRLGFRKKPFLMLADKPLLAHTLDAFESCEPVDAVIVVVGADDVSYCKKEIVEKFALKKVIDVIPGGKERQDSIQCALDLLGTLQKKWDVVVVHDGARPLVTATIIADTIKAAIKTSAAITAVPPKDTIKELASDGTVSRTIARDTLACVQTPQAFAFDILRAAYDKAASDNFTGTDDSSLVERLGTTVTVVPGSYENIKVTTQEDIAISLEILKNRE